MKGIKILSILCLLLFLSSCGFQTEKNSNEGSDLNEKSNDKENTNEDNNEVEVNSDENSNNENEQPDINSEEVSIAFSNFFMKDNSVAKYLGEGNEYATYTARTQWHNDHTVSIFEDNGGTILLRTYRITDEAIELINEQGEFYGEFNPTNEELDAMPAISTFLQLPIEKGREFDGWKIIAVNLTLETPLQKFEEVIQIQKIDETGSIQNRYIVENFGEIKREFIMNEEDIKFSVTSTIESIEQKREASILDASSYV